MPPVSVCLLELLESLPNRYSSQILHREGIAGELKRDGNFFGPVYRIKEYSCFGG